MSDQRVLARSIFDAGVAAANPYHRVKHFIERVSDEPTLIVAVGKAAGFMATAALDEFPDVKTLVVTNYENAKPLDGATVMAAGHPVPDENGQRAGQAVIQALREASGPVLALISGGGSALLPAPAGDISLTDKAQVNRLLLGAGIDIKDMNLVRQQLSDLKGGGMLRLTSPHHVTALILSDVIGDDLSAIASGPTAPPLGNNDLAREILEANHVWEKMPKTVQTHLSRQDKNSELPKHTNILIGSNGQSVAAMASHQIGINVIPFAVEGDVAEVAERICENAQPGVTVWGGETTVRLQGDGRGGRNQELALRIALKAQSLGWRNWTCLQGGSDGRDGPTDAAGGLVDQDTLSRIANAGGDIKALLANNDSYAALQLANDLLLTDATGTNVADLGVLIRA